MLKCDHVISRNHEAPKAGMTVMLIQERDAFVLNRFQRFVCIGTVLAGFRYRLLNVGVQGVITMVFAGQLCDPQRTGTVKNELDFITGLVKLPGGFERIHDAAEITLIIGPCEYDNSNLCHADVVLLGETRG